jgi:hypothetical protein
MEFERIDIAEMGHSGAVPLRGQLCALLQVAPPKQEIVILMLRDEHSRRISTYNIGDTLLWQL